MSAGFNIWEDVVGQYPENEICEQQYYLEQIKQNFCHEVIKLPQSLTRFNEWIANANSIGQLVNQMVTLKAALLKQQKIIPESHHHEITESIWQLTEKVIRPLLDSYSIRKTLSQHSMNEYKHN